MKKALCFILSLVAAGLLVYNKDEIFEIADNVLNFSHSIEWEEFSAQKSNLGSKYKNHFNALDDNQKKAYNNILSEILSATEAFPSAIEVPYMTGDELTEVFEAVIYDNPEIICIGRDNKILTDGDLCYFQPNYIMTPAEQKEINASVSKKCDEILSLIPQNATLYDKQLFIHDYIVNNCVYDTDVTDKSSTAYSCIVEGLSACEGYSKAAKIFLEKSGIECYTISGKAKNFDGNIEGHMWNIVNIDGEYYHLDITWDDPTAPDGKQSLSHLFMNVSDEEISADHSEYISDFKCTSNKANYFVKSGKLFSSFDDADYTRLKKLIAKCENKHIEIKFANSKAYKSATDYLINNGKIYRLLRSVNKTYGTKFSTESIKYIDSPERNTLELFFN